MRCNICDHILTPEEVKFNDHGHFEPCRTCVEASFDDLPQDELILDEDFDTANAGC